MSEFNLEYRAPGELKPRERSYRTHSEAQIARLMASVSTYGFNQPVGIDIDNRIVAGMALVEVAKRLRMNRIPVVVLDHLNDGQLRAYAIAVNKIADQAGYDDAELALELADIREFFGDVEVPELGLTAVEVDELIGLHHINDDESAEVAPERGEVICEAGDLWQMGRHRLLCGDALRGDTYDILMAGDRAQFVRGEGRWPGGRRGPSTIRICLPRRRAALCSDRWPGMEFLSAIRSGKLRRSPRLSPSTGRSRSRRVRARPDALPPT